MMLQELKWTSLQQRRQEQRLVNLYKCVNNINGLQIPPYAVRPTRGQNSNSFIPISCNNDSYKYSYFPDITGMEESGSFRPRSFCPHLLSVLKK
jgi:hypothetical protein